jgi:hypothetical protein
VSVIVDRRTWSGALNRSSKELSMKFRAIAMLCVVGLAAVAGAQPYTGVVTGDNVYVRPQANPQWYPCTKLSHPAQVDVVDEDNGWCEILPPQGVWSVISKRYVQPDATGQVGVVTGENVWVRAAGDLRDTGFWALQSQLDSGARVRILGEIEDYYKITPPEGVHFFISKQYVRPVGSEPVRRDESREQPDPTEATEAPVQPTTRNVIVPHRDTTDTDAETDEAPARRSAEPTAYDAAMERYRQAEKDLRAEWQKPLLQRDLDRLRRQFRAVDAPAETGLQQYVTYWLAFVDRAEQLRRRNEKFESLVKETKTQEQQFDLQEVTKKVEATAKQEPSYVAKGVLAPSAVFTGGPTAPKRWLLRDPTTGAIVAYVETAGAVNLKGYEGQYVGVLGRSSWSESLRTNIVHARQVRDIDEKVSLPAPPRPRVAPLPPAPEPLPPSQPASPAERPAVTRPPTGPRMPGDAEPSPTPADEVEPLPVDPLPVEAMEGPVSEPVAPIDHGPVPPSGRTSDTTSPAQPVTEPTSPSSLEEVTEPAAPSPALEASPITEPEPLQVEPVPMEREPADRSEQTPAAGPSKAEPNVPIPATAPVREPDAPEVTARDGTAQAPAQPDTARITIVVDPRRMDADITPGQEVDVMGRLKMGRRTAVSRVARKARLLVLSRPTVADEQRVTRATLSMPAGVARQMMILQNACEGPLWLVDSASNSTTQPATRPGSAAANGDRDMSRELKPVDSAGEQADGSDEEEVVVSEPLPSTGLPMAEPEPGLRLISESEYD